MSGRKSMDRAAAEKLEKDKLTVATTRFGEITVDQDKVITMTTPFLGFSESKRFVLRPHGPGSPFMWFQSLDNAKLAFVIIQPSMIDPEYQPTVPSHIREELGASAKNDLEFLLILTIPKERPQDMTANLLGPLVINTRQRLAKQVLLDPLKYDLCRPVLNDGS